MGLFFATGWKIWRGAGWRGCVTQHYRRAAASAWGTAHARVASGMFPRLMANSDQDLNYPHLWFFHPKDRRVRSAWKRKPRRSVCSSLSIGKHFQSTSWLHAVPGRSFSNQHPRNWLGTAISRQIWQFRPRKHKRFLPIGMHPTPMKEITALLATLEEGLRFSPSAPVCWLACYLQLKSLCFKLLCLAMEGGIWVDGRRAKPPHLQQLLREGSRQLPPLPA